MKSILRYPKSCRPAIKKLSRAFGIDYGTAYSSLCLEAALWDMHPSDPDVVDSILCCAKKYNAAAPYS